MARHDRRQRPSLAALPLVMAVSLGGCSHRGDGDRTGATSAPVQLASQTITLSLTMPSGVSFSDVALAAAGSIELGPNSAVLREPGKGATLVNVGNGGVQLQPSALAGDVYSTTATARPRSNSPFRTFSTTPSRRVSRSWSMRVTWLRIPGRIQRRSARSVRTCRGRAAARRPCRFRRPSAWRRRRRIAWRTKVRARKPWTVPQTRLASRDVVSRASPRRAPCHVARRKTVRLHTTASARVVRSNPPNST